MQGHSGICRPLLPSMVFYHRPLLNKWHRVMFNVSKDRDNSINYHGLGRPRSGGHHFYTHIPIHLQRNKAAKRPEVHVYHHITRGWRWNRQHKNTTRLLHGHTEVSCSPFLHCWLCFFNDGSSFRTCTSSTSVGRGGLVHMCLMGT